MGSTSSICIYLIYKMEPVTIFRFIGTVTDLLSVSSREQSCGSSRQSAHDYADTILYSRQIYTPVALTVVSRHGLTCLYYISGNTLKEC